MFSVNGEYLLSGGAQGVQVFRVEDGEQVARMETQYVRCLAVSKDSKWIAAGTNESGGFFLWDAKTYETVFSHAVTWGGNIVYDVDFSPDSTRLVVGSCNSSIWDIATRKEVLTLDHGPYSVMAAKYSPLGDRIATAAIDGTSVRVWNSIDGRLLMEIPITTRFKDSLLWSSTHLFILSRNGMKKIKASTGSVVSEWPIADGNMPCFAPSQHGEYIAHSGEGTIMFWNTSTNTRRNFIRHSEPIFSIALSPDDRFLAIGELRKITIRRLSRVTVSIYGILVTLLFQLLIRPYHTPLFHYTSHSRHQSCRSTMTCSIHGRAINS